MTVALIGVGAVMFVVAVAFFLGQAIAVGQGPECPTPPRRSP